jgi:hypothetical protein
MRAAQAACRTVRLELTEAVVVAEGGYLSSSINIFASRGANDKSSHPLSRFAPNDGFVKHVDNLRGVQKTPVYKGFLTLPWPHYRKKTAKKREKP